MSQVQDVTRAAAIINVAMANGMFPEGKMPADDIDKISEAEKLAELAKQADQIAQTIGKANVPSYPAIEEILFEAHVTVGTGEPQQTPVATEPESTSALAAPAPSPEPEPAPEPAARRNRRRGPRGSRGTGWSR